ncbi:TrbI/VirB10 family protein [Granulicella sibirica]|uniref:Conjugative transfer protein TrbI n=1 Tax=Granulicella sibirica TaxID=2479048 RepID=A0A4Q0SX68_9BACT|nr:TrbI/VirB10 family protein [Granulicella sibirica]RXH55417.1 Conjugative transfer protein TrbI [Granulicella sibirica]
MTDQTPQLSQNAPEPKGVIRKNIKMFVYLGAILLLIVASLFSSKRKTANGTPAKGTPPQPFVQDNTANNIADLQNQLAVEKQKQQQDAQLAAAMAASQTPAQQQVAAMYGPNGQPNMPPMQGQSQNAQPQLTPEQQQQQQLANKERELSFDSRFASNLAYSRSKEEEQRQAQPQTSPQMMPVSAANPYAAALAGGEGSSFVPSRAAGEQPAPEAPKKAPEVNLNSAVGQPYVIFEGAVLDTVLMNRLDGDAVGPVKVLVSNPFYSHDHQHVLIPDGTVVLGEAKKIGTAGFGQQRRMAVVFHRLIMPDGYSVDLDQFHGLDQIGEEGLKDKVNNHYLQIFGTSIALGVIAGAGQIESGGGTITTSGSQAFTNGAAGSVSQTSTTILDRFMQIPPTITIREGHRVKIYFTQDMLLPAYTNHNIPQTF